MSEAKTTPLPPAKGYTDTAEVKCKCGRPVPVHVCVKDLYTPPEVHQARADLEAENKRLREALRIAHDHIDMNALRVSHCKDAEAISAALESKP